MSMTREEAIRELESAIKLSRYYLGVTTGLGDQLAINGLTRNIESREKAIAALREQEERENPKPLTIEELRQMDGEPVYVIPLEKSLKDKSWEEWCVMDGDEAEVPGIEYWSWNLSAYGKTWIAYRHKPKEVQG